MVTQEPIPSIPLCSVRRGCRARLCEYRMRRDDRELLTAMGLTPNCTLRVCRAGEPCIVRVGPTRLGIPRSVARRVYVAPAD